VRVLRGLKLGSKKDSPTRNPQSARDANIEYSFRRSRTITGSASSDVRSASEGRAQLKSPRLHEHTLRRHRRKLLGYLGLVVVASGLLWYAVSQFIGSTDSVRPVAAQIQVVPDKATYTQLVQRYLGEHPFERFLFALNDDQLSAYVRAHAPEVQSVTLEAGDKLWSGELSVKFRQPVAAWTIQNKRYFVDDTGQAFTRNYFAEPSVTVADKSGIGADTATLASAKLLFFIGRLITLINQAQVAEVERVELPAHSTREIDLKLKGHEYLIKLDLSRDPAGQAADVVAAVRYVVAHGIQPQYLDVRVSSKAYYRDR